MRHDLGAKINAGDILAVIHDTDRTGTAPVECRSKVDGIFMGRHFPCLIRPGDFSGSDCYHRRLSISFSETQTNVTENI